MCSVIELDSCWRYFRCKVLIQRIHVFGQRDYQARFSSIGRQPIGQAVFLVKDLGCIAYDVQASLSQLNFDNVKRWVLGGKIFDSFIVNVETSDRPAYGAPSLGPKIRFQSIDEYVRSTSYVDISSIRQNH